MRKKYLQFFLFLLWTVGVMVSCNEKPEDIPPIEIDDRPTGEIEPVEFNVTVDENITLKVGEPVIFHLSGNADLIKLYSGDFKNSYEYHDKNRFVEVGAEISFEHYMFGNNDPHKVNKDHTGILMYCNDFNGDYSYTNVVTTDWKVIEGFTPAEFANGINDANFQNAGTVDISHLFEEGRPLYLAWYYKINSGTRRTGYRLRNFKLDAVVEDNPSLSSTLYILPQLGLQWVLNPAAANHTDGTDRPYVNDTEMRWIWPTSYNVPAEYVAYAVSGPIELPQYDLGKDWPTLFTTEWNNDRMDYSYTYTQAGEYEVVFVASGVNNKERQEIVKKITIQVEE